MQNCFYTRHAFTEEPFKKLQYTSSVNRAQSSTVGHRGSLFSAPTMLPGLRYLLRALRRLSSVDYGKPTLFRLITCILNPYGTHPPMGNPSIGLQISSRWDQGKDTASWKCLGLIREGTDRTWPFQPQFLTHSPPWRKHLKCLMSCSGDKGSIRSCAGSCAWCWCKRNKGQQSKAADLQPLCSEAPSHQCDGCPADQAITCNMYLGTGSRKAQPYECRTGVGTSSPPLYR